MHSKGHMMPGLLLLHRFIVIPQRPAGTEGWSEEHLQVLVTRDSMIGVSLALQPSTIGS